MCSEREISRELIDTTNGEVAGRGLFVEVAGVRVSFPFHAVERAGYDEFVPDEHWQSYKAMRELFCEDELPSSWVRFLKKMDKVREARGCFYPINLVYGAVFVFFENRERFSAKGLPGFKYMNGGEEEGPLDMRDKGQVKSTIDGILSDRFLRARLEEVMKYLLPDQSCGGLGRSEVIDELEKRGWKRGDKAILIDLGCGRGLETIEWQELTGGFVLGCDRQYHGKWYREFWNSGEKDLGFVRADIANGVPVRTGCARAVVMEYVVPYMREEFVCSAVREAKRILMESGILAVGPQEGWEWAMYEKRNNTLVKLR